MDVGRRSRRVRWVRWWIPSDLDERDPLEPDAIRSARLVLDGVMGVMRGTLLVLDGAVALTAIPGGIALAVGAEDQRYPTAWLRRTPFRTYRVPGALLSGLVGGSAAVAAVQLVQRGDAGARWSVPAGIILMGWIGGEILLFDQPDPGSPVELGYLAAGLAMIGLGLRISSGEGRA